MTSKIVLKGPSFFCVPFFFPVDSALLATYPGLVMPQVPELQ